MVNLLPKMPVATFIKLVMWDQITDKLRIPKSRNYPEDTPCLLFDNIREL